MKCSKCRFFKLVVVLAAVAVFVFCTSVAWAEHCNYFLTRGYYPPRWSQTNDTTYDFIKNSGIKWILNNADNYTSDDLTTVAKNLEMLDLCAERGLKMVVCDKRFKTIANATDPEIDAIANDYKDHPALGGYYVWDEPDATQLQAYAHAYNRFLYNDPDSQPYVNLFPVYAGNCGVQSVTEIILQHTTVGGSSNVTSSGSLGQTFKTPANLDRKISQIQINVDSATWGAGESLTLAVYDNPSQNQMLGNPVTLTSTNNGNYPQFTLNAILQPDTAYYYKLTNNGGGNNSIAVVRSTADTYVDGSGYVNGSQQAWDFYFKCTFSEVYQDYLEQWVDAVGAANLNYLLYDNYPLQGPSGYYRADYFYNMEYVRDMGLKKGVATGAHMQACTEGVALRTPTESEMRWNLYTNLAYGVKSLDYFTLSVPNFPQWDDSIIREDGYSDSLYSNVQALNFQTGCLGPTLMELTSQAVYHSGASRPEGTSGVPGDFFWKPASSNDKVIISYFTNSAGRKYIMVVNNSLDTGYTYTFNVNPKPDAVYEVSKSTGNETGTNYNSSTGVISDSFLAGEGKLYALNYPGDVSASPRPTPTPVPTPIPPAAETPRPDTVMVNNNAIDIDYAAVWTLSSARGLGDYQDDVRYTANNGSFVEYVFNGYGIDYITEKNSDMGDVDIYIDGVFQQTVSCYNATRLVQQTVYSNTALSPGYHIIKAVKKNGDCCLLDAFRVHTATLLNNTDNGIAYTGTWALDTPRGYGDYLDDIKYTTNNGDYFEYTFNGTGVDYITEKNSDMGDVSIYIDGVFQQTVSCYNATRLVQQTVYSITGLSSGTHTIKAVKSGGGCCLLDALRVYSSPLVNNSDSSIKYGGIWAWDASRGYGDYGDDVRYTTNNGDYLEYTFNGTGFDYITEKNNDMGDVSIYIDGIFQQTVSCYNATRLVQQAAYSKTGLPSGLHTVRIVKASGGCCILDVFRIYTTPNINNTDSGIVLNGSWTVSSGRGYGDYQDDVVQTTANNDYLEYTFYGIGVDYITEKNNDLGDVAIYVDGVFQQTVSCYNATRLVQQTVYSKTGLTPGTHTIRLVKTGGTYCMLDCFRVNVGTIINDLAQKCKYTGTWGISANRNTGDYQDEVLYTTNNGDYCEYTFSGTAVEFITEKSSDKGNVDIYIDGVFQQSVNCYNASLLAQQSVYGKSGLTPGVHTIKVVKTSGTYCFIDAFRVYSETVNDTENSITYTGTWTLNTPRGYGDYQDNIHYTTTNGDYFEYTFTGTSVEYITEKNWDMGDVDIYIDGIYRNTVSCYNATRLVQQAVYRKTGLKQGTHTLKVVKVNGDCCLLDAIKAY